MILAEVITNSDDLMDLLESIDIDLDVDTYDQFRRDDDLPDDAEIVIRAGTARKITKLINEIYWLRNHRPT